MRIFPGDKVCVGVLLLTLTSCMPRARSEYGLQRELAAARHETQSERLRVQQLEERLARLERAQATRADSPTSPASNPEQARVSAQLEQLILMNQNLLLEVQAQRLQRPGPGPESTPSKLALSTGSHPAKVPPECNTGLSTEQKILELVLELRGQRSPWRVDGLSYEESQALKFLLRPERELDARNPWQ